jgi:hypothetical protein
MWPLGSGATLADMVLTDLPQIVDAVEQHRLRMAALLDGLDGARRAASRSPLAALVAHFSDDLRASDTRLQALVADLRRRQP